MNFSGALVKYRAIYNNYNNSIHFQMSPLIFHSNMSSLAYPPWTSELAGHVFLTALVEAQEGTLLT